MKLLLSKILFITLVLFITACSSNPKNYRDISELERPPLLEGVVLKPELAVDSEKQKKVTTGLGDVVQQVDARHLRLKQPQSRAWRTLEKSLEQSKIEIVDKNLKLGVYFVNFAVDSPDEEPSLLQSLFSKKLPTTAFLIMLNAIDADTVEITTRRATDKDEPIDTPTAIAGAEKLLKKLYLSLHDDFSFD